MPKCERYGLNGDSLELKMCPDKITKWANKPICKQCYSELKKIEENKFSKDKSTFQYFSENNNLEKKISKRSIIIYVLFILWIVIGVLFIGAVFQKTSEYFDNIDSFSRHMGDDFINYITFQHLLFIILFVIIITISFLLAYCTFIKKRKSLLIGLMFSSFLLYFGFRAIYFIGFLILSEKLDQFFRSFEYITYMLMLIIVPIVIYIQTREEVKAYFGKI